MIEAYRGTLAVYVIPRHWPIADCFLMTVTGRAQKSRLRAAAAQLAAYGDAGVDELVISWTEVGAGRDDVLDRGSASPSRSRARRLRPARALQPARP